MDKRDAAMVHQISWKPETRRYALAVVRRAIELYRSGTVLFGSDDLEEGPQGPDSDGIAGGAFHWLRGEGIIRHAVVISEDGEAVPRMRKSKRPCSNGRRICLYELVNMAAAETFLQRNSLPCEVVKVEQPVLFDLPAAPLSRVH